MFYFILKIGLSKNQLIIIRFTFFLIFKKIFNFNGQNYKLYYQMNIKINRNKIYFNEYSNE
jgi:hypothetical protein